jgi:hypothetical protein
MKDRLVLKIRKTNYFAAFPDEKYIKGVEQILLFDSL